VNYDTECVNKSSKKYKQLPEQVKKMEEKNRKDEAEWRREKLKMYAEVSSLLI
jgi:hypothetical protein